MFKINVFQRNDSNRYKNILYVYDIHQAEILAIYILMLRRRRIK